MTTDKETKEIKLEGGGVHFEASSAQLTSHVAFQIAHTWQGLKDGDHLLFDVVFKDTYIMDKETAKHNIELVKRLKAEIKTLNELLSNLETYLGPDKWESLVGDTDD